jgi:hypothetical protein
MWPTTIKYTEVIMWNARYFRPILNKSGFSWQIFLKVFNIKCYENTSSGSRVDICGQTDMTKIIGVLGTIWTRPKFYSYTSGNTLLLHYEHKPINFDYFDLWHPRCVSNHSTFTHRLPPITTHQHSPYTIVPSVHRTDRVHLHLGAQTHPNFGHTC